MPILDTTSLASTLNAVDEELLFGRRIPAPEAEATVSFIISRHNAGPCYRGMFAPTERDRREGYATFTGEHTSRTADGAAGHVLGEEACRVLRLLGADDACALTTADKAFEQVAESVRHGTAGWYCCTKCSTAMWRHLVVLPTEEARGWLRNGVGLLRELRKPDGRWKRAAFYYTVLALTEMPHEIGREELQFAAPTCERLLRHGFDGPYSERRKAIVERALSRV